MDKLTQQYLLNLVKKNYEEIASDFDNTRKKHPWPELEKLTEPVKDSDKVLDVGCGNGRLLWALGGKSLEYLGVDSSQVLINIAKQNFQIPKEKYKFVVGDVLELDKLPDKNFDYVYCVAVLHHLPGKDLRVRALKQMKNKLKPGGKLIISVWNLWSQKKFRRLINKYAVFKILGKNKMDFGDILFDWKNNQGEQVSQRYYHAFTKREFKKIAIRAELKLEKLYKDKYNYYAIFTK